MCRRVPAIDVARVQDVDLFGAPDEAILAWAAAAGRVLVTHDASTMTARRIGRAAGRVNPMLIA